MLIDGHTIFFHNYFDGNLFLHFVCVCIASGGRGGFGGWGCTVYDSYLLQWNSHQLKKQLCLKHRERVKT